MTINDEFYETLPDEIRRKNKLRRAKTSKAKKVNKEAISMMLEMDPNTNT